MPATLKLKVSSADDMVRLRWRRESHRDARPPAQVVLAGSGTDMFARCGKPNRRSAWLEMSSETLVLPNVYGLIRDSAGGVLIQRRWKPRSDPDTLGMWELPGGKWRAGESAQDCLQRELQEECGLGLSSVDGRFVKHSHLGQHVETSTPLLVVQMLVGPYTSVLVIYSGFSNGQPAPQGDGARDAHFMKLADLQHALTADADTFTALSYAALTELAARDLL